MPAVVATRRVARPRDEIWRFVSDMDRWAPMLQGYVAHQRQSETDSVWTLQGDLGPFSRRVTLRVQLTEVTAPERITFILVGVGEDARGSGTFQLTEPPPEIADLPPRPWWRRLLDWLLRRVPPSPAAPAARSTDVRFTFLIDAGGPMAPMINALLGPFADEVARDLVDRVGAHLEETRT